jgi:hypothetical protein
MPERVPAGADLEPDAADLKIIPDHAEGVLGVRMVDAAEYQRLIW